MKIAFVDCFSGINGMMFAAALVDAGLTQELILECIEQLNLDERFEIVITEMQKGALRAKALEIHISNAQHYKHLADIRSFLNKSSLPEKVIEQCTRVYNLLAEAEACVHGESIDTITFHEIGRLNAIIRTVVSIWGLRALNIEKVYSSALPYNCGMFDSEHGRLPLPSPATLEVMRLARIPLVPSPATTELVSPSGAALLGEIASFNRPAMVVEKVGIGAGKEDLPWPNVLRLMIGEKILDTKADSFTGGLSRSVT